MSDASTTKPAVGTAFVTLILGMTVIVAALILGLVFISGPEGRTETLTWIFNILTLLGVGGVGLKQHQQTKVTEVIKHQTNGHLKDVVREQFAAVLAEQAGDGIHRAEAGE